MIKVSDHVTTQIIIECAEATIWENCMIIDRRLWGYRRNSQLNDWHVI
jgi:hypothetical protein